jgi:hypothetical protein
MISCCSQSATALGAGDHASIGATRPAIDHPSDEEQWRLAAIEGRAWSCGARQCSGEPWSCLSCDGIIPVKLPERRIGCSHADAQSVQSWSVSLSRQPSSRRRIVVCLTTIMTALRVPEDTALRYANERRAMPEHGQLILIAKDDRAVRFHVWQLVAHRCV